jgi:hypothetical protein
MQSRKSPTNLWMAHHQHGVAVEVGQSWACMRERGFTSVPRGKVENVMLSVDWLRDSRRLPAPPSAGTQSRPVNQRAARAVTALRPPSLLF